MKPLLRLLAITGALMFLFSGSAVAKCCGGEDIPDAQECCSEVPVPDGGFCCGGEVYTDNSLQCCHDLGAYNPNEEICCTDGPITRTDCGPGKHAVCPFGTCECDNPLPDEPCKIWNSSTCHLDDLGTTEPSSADEPIDPVPKTSLAGLNSTFPISGKATEAAPARFCKGGNTVSWTAGTPVWAWTSTPTGNIVGDTNKETVQLKTSVVSTAANDITLSYTRAITYVASDSSVPNKIMSSSGSGTYTVVKVEIDDIGGTSTPNRIPIHGSSPNNIEGSADVTITPLPLPTGAHVRMEIHKIGSSPVGDANFDSGIKTIDISEDTTLKIHGVTNSTVKENLKISAKLNGAGVDVAEKKFTVRTWPNNWRELTGSRSNTGGVLYFEYDWDSEAGDKNKIPSDIKWHELVAYTGRVPANSSPGSNNPYLFPNPPFNQSAPNPTMLPIPNKRLDTGAPATDFHGIPNMATTWGLGSVTASQTYRFWDPLFHATENDSVIIPGSSTGPHSIYRETRTTTVGDPVEWEIHSYHIFKHSYEGIAIFPP